MSFNCAPCATCGVIYNPLRRCNKMTFSKFRHMENHFKQGVCYRWHTSEALKLQFAFQGNLQPIELWCTQAGGRRVLSWLYLIPSSCADWLPRTTGIEDHVLFSFTFQSGSAQNRRLSPFPEYGTGNYNGSSSLEQTDGLAEQSFQCLIHKEHHCEK